MEVSAPKLMNTLFDHVAMGPGLTQQLARGWSRWPKAGAAAGQRLEPQTDGAGDDCESEAAALDPAAHQRDQARSGQMEAGQDS